MSSEIIKDAIKASLEFSQEQIVVFVKKFRDRKLAFIEDEKTIELAKEQYNSGESKFYHNYIHNKKLLFLVGMGLTLRKVEENKEKRQNLRSKIFNKEKVDGLHVAEFVQNGILNRFNSILLELVDTIEDLEKQIEKVLKNIDKYSIFVQGRDRIGEIIRRAINITDSHSPIIFVISGEGSCAKLLSDNVKKIEDSLKRYNLERISTSNREILFFKLNLHSE
jgi:hypothetical protein